MNEHWERVTTLFAAARALDERSRASFLAAACEGDPVLRTEVEALLAANEPDDAFLEDPPWAHLAPPNAVRLSSGELLKGRYRIHEELGEGGQAVVYRATDVLLDRSVVIKVMRPEGRWSSWLKSRFEQEMNALARIDHSGVVGILDVGELDDASPFLVIQHIDGMSLREALSRGPMPRARVAEILRQVGSALHAAHAAGIAHRDLKPENVMLQSRDEGGVTVKIIDFGIAKIDQSELAPNTTTVMIAGTVRYMAPEQFEGHNSPASDIYSLALIVCEMLSGQPHIRALAKSTPTGVRAALEAALAYRPEERPDNVQSWSEQLAGALGAGSRRRPRIAAGIVLVFLVAGTTATHRWVLEGAAEPVRVIEKVGAFDPLTEGFTPFHDVTGRIVENATNTGYDAWRIVTEGQGYYYQTFTRAQKRRALERGWTLTAIMKTEEGAAGVGADFLGEGGRYNIVVIRDGDREIVRLSTQIVPDLRGMDYVQTPAGQYHEYALIYDPNLKSADLWVDGVRRLTGYTGFSQFQKDRGLLFSAMVHNSERGSGVFRSVRFEITP
jgi:tRNA A-37 threonylcarbamoyl transferase component Bud32